VSATRREFLQRGSEVAAASVLGGLWIEAAAAAPPAPPGFDAGPLQHLLATANHERLLVKASFARPLDEAPRLRVAGTSIRGRRSDHAGRFWRWDVDGLAAGRPHELRLRDGRGRTLTEPWEIKTFPRPQSRPERVRLLIFTCPGGHDAIQQYGIFQPTRVRNRLLRRGLSFEPDAVIANGDHVYWDLEAPPTAVTMGLSPIGRQQIGTFDPDKPKHNAALLTRAAGPQIVDVYGVDCRSVPVFFLTDDHDYYENDVATEEMVTFPPPGWKLRLGRRTQHLYYPEFLPVPGQPDNLPWTRNGLHECFGALRYGRLLEFLMYDVRRTMTMRGKNAVFFHPRVERWVRRRLAGNDVTHVVNMPSNPPAWSAGKWMEWYPDVLGPDRQLTTALEKPYWQSGWRSQHDRLMRAISARRRGAALVVGGDLHATAAGTIERSGTIDLRRNPVHVVLSGTLGSKGAGFPSGLRATPPRPTSHVDLREEIPPLEENGFMVADVTPDKITLRFFRWNDRTQPEEAIDGLQPFRTIELEPA
jgi:hypothetical protein